MAAVPDNISEFQYTEIQQTLLECGRKDFTFVVLGETGVGKTSWINSFANFLCNDSFKDAMENNKVYYLIPSTFKHENKKPRISGRNRKQATNDQKGRFDQNKVEVISIGNPHQNENQEAVGASCTQEPFSYKITCSGERDYGKVDITIIDTPGVGDTRGEEKDAENVMMILNHLGNYKTIDAFIILLESNRNRLTPEFEKHIQLLFSQLNKSAALNVIFGFSYSSHTNFKATNTKEILKQLFLNIEVPFELDENRCFFFDSSPFRHLAILANKQRPDKGDMSDVWDENLNSWNNLITFVSELEPHDLANTLSIQKAQLTVNSVITPLVEINKIIKENTKRIEKCILEAESNSLKTSEFYLAVILSIFSPNVVCENDECHIPLLPGKFHRRICHEHCFENNSYLLILTGGFTCDIFKKDEKDSSAPLLCMICNHPKTDHTVKPYRPKEARTERLFRGTIHELKSKAETLKNEFNVISSSLMSMANFATNHALVKGRKATKDVVKNFFIKMINDDDDDVYEENTLFAEIDLIQNEDLKKPDDVDRNLETLFRLEETGNDIKKAYYQNKEGKDKAFQRNERNQLQLSVANIPFILIDGTKSNKTPTENNEITRSPTEVSDNL